MKKLKIAQVANLWEPVPPPTYGGASLIASLITEELVRRGHEVTLFAPGNSKTKANLVSIYPRGLYRDGFPWNTYDIPLLHQRKAFLSANKFDILHGHISADHFSLYFSDFVKTPSVITVHNRFPDKRQSLKPELILETFKNHNFVALSNRFRSHVMPDLNYVDTVYNGIDVKAYKFNTKPSNYLAWIGRMHQDKGTKEAILVAKALGKKIILAGKIDRQSRDSQEYFKKEVEHLINGKTVVFLGEVGFKKKNELLSEAEAVLVPTNWEEPFGLVPIEAMACGTPVVAFNKGATPELIVDGKTGFVVEQGDIKGMAKATIKALSLSRYDCRRHVEENFTVEKMVRNYEKVYEKLLK